MYCVLTGDLVKSSSLKAKRKDIVIILNTLFAQLKNLENKTHEIWISDIFSGDSFQVVVSDAVFALKIALFIRAQLIQRSVRGPHIEARIAIGIGNIEYLNKNKLTESDGEAFRLSGRAINKMISYRRLIVKSDDEQLNLILEVISSLLDAITSRWTPEQAEAISFWLFGETQASLAKKMGISQSAIHQRLQLAGHFAIESCLNEFNSIFHN